MFTINIYLRFALMAATLLLSIVCWSFWGFWYGFPFLLTFIILTAGYFLLGTVLSSFQLIQNSNFEAAEQRLALTFFPKALIFLMRSQFYMAKSTLAMQKKDFSAAESLTKKAIETGFSSDNEKGIAYLQLAGIAAQKNNRVAATNYLNDLKKLKITEPMIKEQIKIMEHNMKQMQQNMNPSQMFMMMGKGGFRGGSKRPRPKIR